MSTTFSTVDHESTRTLAAVQASRSAAVSISSGSGSAARRHDQSVGSRRGRTTNHRIARPTRTAPMTSGANHGTSCQVSVKSSWATWIQYSCGSLMTIQMQRGGDEPEAGAEPARVPAQPHQLVGDEEVLEGVGEDQQQGAVAGDLEGHHPDHPVEEEEPRDADRRAARPVLQRGQEGDGQVEQVHRLVVVLVARGVEAEPLEDRLVDPVEHQAGEDRRQRPLRDEEGDQEAQPDDDDEDDGGLGRHPGSPVLDDAVARRAPSRG